MRTCTALKAEFRHAETVIDSSVVLASGSVKLGGKDVAEHCLVKGHMRPREGVGGQRFAIGFEMRLPAAWNGRFYYQGNGGLDGAVQPALGALGGGPLTGALSQGFAVISSDAGHTMSQTPVFGTDPQARLDYGYQAVGLLTPMAKALIAAAYGKGPDRSYIGGCSNGGRHAMVAAARFGDAYDGYLAGAPGYRLPIASLHNMWASNRWRTLATPGATFTPQGFPRPVADLGTALTTAERRTIADAILKTCDAFDGAQDGIAHDVRACQAAFDPDRDIATCSGERSGACLTAAQKAVLKETQAGYKSADGQAFYTSFTWDTAIATPDWADWKFVQSITRSALGSATVFGTPPTPPYDPATLDIDQRRRAMDVTDDRHRESVLSLMTPPGQAEPENLRPLWARGARMILYHGTGDPIFSAEDTRLWFERVDRVQGGRATESVRLFMVPGMPHCRGGAATDQFDLLGPLVRWVEQGIAPDAVIARARGAGNPGGANGDLPAAWPADVSRPLCAWPAVARYTGNGPVHAAASYACRR